MYLLNDYASLEQLSQLLWNLHYDYQPGQTTVRMFGAQDTPVGGYLEYQDDFEINFTVDKTAEIKALVLAMEPDITEATLDATVDYLIANSPVQFGTLLAQMGVTTRDRQYLIDNGYIAEDDV